TVQKNAVFCQLKTEKEKSETSYYAQNDVIMTGCGELYCANNPLIYTDPDGQWAIGFKLFGFGFSIGDKGISASVPFATVGVDFSDGSAYGAVGVDFGSQIEYGVGSAGYSLGVSYTHNFMRGGPDVYGASAGIHGDIAGFGGGGGYFHDFRNGKKSWSQDYNMNLDRMREVYRETVGHNPNMNPGQGVSGVDGVRDRMDGEAFLEGTNAWGNPTNKQVNVTLNPLSWVEWSFVNVFPGREGGPLSRHANRVPGQNAFSYLHDKWATNIFYSVATVPFAQVVTYGAYVQSILP
ncbi:MAG: hypothetical protein GY710_26415, partial [Desulfobacteraceae bacterium]|nr:hypothetical protein [Desulfobacteraceae bacterium]